MLLEFYLVHNMFENFDFKRPLKSLTFINGIKYDFIMEITSQKD